jgi:hypothetical protein
MCGGFQVSKLGTVLPTAPLYRLRPCVLSIAVNDRSAITTDNCSPDDVCYWSQGTGVGCALAHDRLLPLPLLNQCDDNM